MSAFLLSNSLRAASSSVISAQSLQVRAQVGKVVLGPVDVALKFELVGFLVRDLLIFLGAAKSDFLHGRIQLFQLGVWPISASLSIPEQLPAPSDLIAVSIVVAEEADVEGSRLVLKMIVLLGLFGLALEAGHLALDFGDDIVDPEQVLVGRFDLAQGFDLALLVAGDPGGLFDEDPPFIRAGIGDGADISLLDDGVGFGAHAAAHEDVVDVLETARLLVEQVGAFSRAERRRVSMISEIPAVPRVPPLSLTRVRETSAMFSGDLPMAPEKITSSIALPRSCLTLCSPMTQRKASTILLLPHPLGPTTAQMPGGKAMVAFSGNDLNPMISSFFSFIAACSCLPVQRSALDQVQQQLLRPKAKL